MTNDHLSLKEIQSYIQNELSEKDNDRIIVHLSECEACLSRVDAEWVGESRPAPDLMNSNIEKRLLSTINRSNLAGNLIGLGVKGFLDTVVGVLAPLLHTRSTKPPRKLK